MKASKKEWVIDDARPTNSEAIGHPTKDIVETPPALQEAETDEQRQKYATVLAHFKEHTKHAVTENKCPEDQYRELSEVEEVWLSKQCMLRYLRACNWVVDDAIKRLEKSIGWRREFGVAEPDGSAENTLTAEKISPENETGKIMVYGFDKGGRPCLQLYSGKQNTKTSPRQIQHMFYMLERAIDFMPKGQDKLALCVDFKKYPEYCTADAKIPSVSLGRQVLHILQYHYPERLGRALFINIPWLVWGFLKLCWPFVDPYTKTKCKFDEPWEQFIDEQQLDVNHGGKVNFAYKHADYWPEFNRLAVQRRKVILDNYKRLGGGIGLDETELRQGID